MGRALAQTPAPMRVDTQTTHHWGGTYDGSSWLNAVGNLQEAIDNQFAGGEIWVKEGTYSPLTQLTGFVISKQLSLYGGFHGDELYLSDRHGSFANTLLNGNQCEHAVSIPQVAGSTVIVLDGFRIAYGHASGSGGGILCQGWDLNLANCFVDTNFATNQGGGLYFDGTGIGNPALLYHTLLIKTTSFTSNHVDDFDGGGIYATHVRGKAVNCYFSSNVAPQYGGGVFLGSMDPPDRFDFTNSVFLSNSAANPAPQGRGGAIYLDSGSANSTLVNCTLASNSAADNSGGQAVYIKVGGQAHFYNSILYFNSWSAITPTIVGVAAAEFSDIQDTTLGNGNINSDPAFRSLSGGNLRLKFNTQSNPVVVSPCLDRADYGRIPTDDLDVDNDGSTTEIIGIDLDKAPRTVDLLPNTYAPNLGVGYPGCPTCSGGYLDMGAYER